MDAFREEVFTDLRPPVPPEEALNLPEVAESADESPRRMIIEQYVEIDMVPTMREKKYLSGAYLHEYQLRAIPCFGTYKPYNTRQSSIKFYVGNMPGLQQFMGKRCKVRAKIEKNTIIRTYGPQRGQPMIFTNLALVSINPL